MKFIIFYGRATQVYATGRNDVYLNVWAIMRWIFNAVLYAIIINLLSFYVLVPTFMYMDLYEAGTIVFTALCMALQCKVALLHHQWAYPNIIAMGVSVVGMIGMFLLFSVTTNDYWGVAQHDLGLEIFWFFGFFSIPLIAVMLDMVGYDLYMFFTPTPELQYQEIQNQVKLIPRFSPSLSWKKS
jgi:hypothetical protein